MVDFIEICQKIKAAGGSDVYLYSDSPILFRLNGQIQKLEDFSVTQDLVKKIILQTSTAKAREILGKQRQVSYAETIEEIGRLRFSVFLSKGKFAITARILKERYYEFEELGFDENIKKIISQFSGLIMVASPSGEGKTSTIASILNFINTHFEKSIFTIENPVEFLFKDQLSTFIQRSIPVDVSNFYNGLCEAYRIVPDVIVSDSLNYPDAMDQALVLCESGRLVIGSTEGGDSQQVIERLINIREPSERESIRNHLATHLKLIISQRLVPLQEENKNQAIFDIFINNLQMKNLIKNNNMAMFRSLQEQNTKKGMKTFDEQLLALLRKLKIQKKTAIEFAIDKSKIP